MAVMIKLGKLINNIIRISLAFCVVQGPVFAAENEADSSQSSSSSLDAPLSIFSKQDDIDKIKNMAIKDYIPVELIQKEDANGISMVDARHSIWSEGKVSVVMKKVGDKLEPSPLQEVGIRLATGDDIAVGRYFRVVKDNKGNFFRRILVYDSAGEKVIPFDMVMEDPVESQYNPSKIKYILNNPRFWTHTSKRYLIDSVGFYVAGNLVNRITNGFRSDTETKELMKKIESGQFSAQASQFINEQIYPLANTILHIDKMFDFEPIMDPIFYETEINRLKDPHGQANFFSFIAINSLYGQILQTKLRNKDYMASITPQHAKFLNLAAGQYASMGVASLGANIVTEIGFGIADCTLPKVMKYAEEDNIAALTKCDRFKEDFVNSKMAQRWFFDMAFSLLPTVYFSHLTSKFFTGAFTLDKMFEKPSLGMPDTRGRVSRAVSAGATKLDKVLMESTRLGKNMSVWGGVRNFIGASYRIPVSILRRAGGAVLKSGGPVAQFAFISIPSFANFLWWNQRMMYNSMPLVELSHATSLQWSDWRTQSIMDSILKGDEVDPQDLKDQVYYLGRKFEDWRTFVKSSYQVALSNWINAGVKLVQKADAAQFFYTGLVNSFLEYKEMVNSYMSNEMSLTKIPQAYREAFDPFISDDGERSYDHPETKQIFDTATDKYNFYMYEDYVPFFADVAPSIDDKQDEIQTWASQNSQSFFENYDYSSNRKELIPVVMALRSAVGDRRDLITEEVLWAHKFLNQALGENAALETAKKQAWEKARYKMIQVRTNLIGQYYEMLKEYVTSVDKVLTRLDQTIKGSYWAQAQVYKNERQKLNTYRFAEEEKENLSQSLNVDGFSVQILQSFLEMTPTGRDQFLSNFALLKEITNRFSVIYKGVSCQAEEIAVSSTNSVKLNIAKGNGKCDRRATQYYQQLDYGVKQLAEYIRQNPDSVDRCSMANSATPDCLLVGLHQGLGRPGYRGQRFMWEMNKRLLDPKGSVRINAELFSGSFSGLSTPLPAEELLAGMVCGVDPSNRKVLDINALMYSEIKEMTEMEKGRILGCQEKYHFSLWNQFKSYVRGEDEYEQMIKGYRECLMDNIANAQIRDSVDDFKGFSKTLNFPRITGEYAAQTCDQIKVGRVYAKAGIQKGNIYDWKFRYTKVTREGDKIKKSEKETSGLMKVLFRNLNQSSVVENIDEIKFRHGSNEAHEKLRRWVNDWIRAPKSIFVDSAVNMYRRINQIETMPVQLGKNLYELRKQKGFFDQENAWRPEGLSIQEFIDFTFDWGAKSKNSRYGVADSYFVELDYYVNQLLFPMAGKLIQKGDMRFTENSSEDARSLSMEESMNVLHAYQKIWNMQFVEAFINTHNYVESDMGRFPKRFKKLANLFKALAMSLGDDRMGFLVPEDSDSGTGFHNGLTKLSDEELENRQKIMEMYGQKPMENANVRYAKNLDSNSKAMRESFGQIFRNIGSVLLETASDTNFIYQGLNL